ncbi:hypothetical protein HDU85_004163 [Gaertneriomyces sp. JEL0708]|nr:hypothetical protein HDU85_004163 [Gaertneriomyces sp. JEL0708]
MTDKKVKQLSSSVLSLKFMHRAEEAKQRQTLAEQQKRAQEEAEWVVADFDRDDFGLDAGVEYEYESSFLPFLDTTYGRKSFGKFNKEIESMSKEANTAARLAQAEENEKRDSVSDKEMASRLQEIREERSNIDSNKKRKRERALSEEEKTDWNKLRGRQATRFNAGKGWEDEKPQSHVQKSFMKPPE